MQYNCLDRFLWLQVWINVHTSHRVNKVGFLFLKKMGLKTPIANFLSNFHGRCPLIKLKSRQMQCYLLLLTQGTQKAVAHPHTDRRRRRKNRGGWWKLAVRASCGACGKVIVIEDSCFGLSNTAVLRNLKKKINSLTVISGRPPIMEDKGHEDLFLSLYGDICRTGETGKYQLTACMTNPAPYHHHANPLDFKMTLGALTPSTRVLTKCDCVLFGNC